MTRPGEELLSPALFQMVLPLLLGGSSRNVTLDYTVQITISQPEAVFRFPRRGGQGH